MFAFRLRTISEKFENRAFDNAVTFLPSNSTLFSNRWRSYVLMDKFWHIVVLRLRVVSILRFLKL